MANKETEITALTKPKSEPFLLTYEEYYDTLMTAKKIRLENEEALKNAESPKAKTTLLEQLFIKYNVPANSSSSPKDKELATLLKINIFIPDNEQFIADYKTKFGKNVRLISDAYQIPAPFVFQKVTEIGKYEQYLNRIEKEGGLKEVTLEDNSVLGVINTIANSGMLKPLYDEQATPNSKKNKKAKKKSPAKKEKQVAPTLEEPKASISKPATPPTELSGLVSEQVLQHLDSMQRYCTRLLDQNEQLSTQNTSLLSFRKELETLLGKLREENSILKGQMSTLTEENVKLQKQVEDLTQQNVTLEAQIAIKQEYEPSPRSIAEETATEKELRKQIKDLQFTNQELTTQCAEEKEKKEQYRSRAIIAEVQLEQLEHGMQGIFQEVDALDFDLASENTKKS